MLLGLSNLLAPVALSVENEKPLMYQAKVLAEQSASKLL